jgi:hypothetical protein
MDESLNELFVFLESEQRDSALALVLAMSLDEAFCLKVVSNKQYIKQLLASVDPQSVNSMINISSFNSTLIFLLPFIPDFMKAFETYKNVLTNISFFSSEELVLCFKDHLPNLFMRLDSGGLEIILNLSVHEIMRRCLLANPELETVLESSKHPSLVLLLKNLLFEVDFHDQIPLMKILDYLVFILFTCVDTATATFSEPEMKSISALNISKFEKNSHLLETVECLILIGTRMKGRSLLRSRLDLYPILREFDKQQTDNIPLKEEIEKLVGYLIRDEQSA